MVYINATNNLRQRLLNQLTKLSYPKKGKERLLSMIEEDRIGAFQTASLGSSFTNIFE